MTKNHACSYSSLSSLARPWWPCRVRQAPAVREDGSAQDGCCPAGPAAGRAARPGVRARRSWNPGVGGEGREGVVQLDRQASAAAQRLLLPRGTVAAVAPADVRRFSACSCHRLPPALGLADGRLLHADLPGEPPRRTTSPMVDKCHFWPARLFAASLARAHWDLSLSRSSPHAAPTTSPSHLPSTTIGDRTGPSHGDYSIAATLGSISAVGCPILRSQARSRSLPPHRMARPQDRDPFFWSKATHGAWVGQKTALGRRMPN